MDPIVARKTWRTVEPLHGIVYFATERDEAYDALGLRREQGYFVSRSAAMGAVTPEVVIATFFNFHPGLVRRAMADGWTTATPETVTAARLDAVDTSLRRAFGSELLASGELRRAAELTRRAALVACAHPEGRPLFAGHASLPWPVEPHLVLWHAQTLLREFRGDAHVAALTAEGLSGIEALVIHAATGEIPAEILRTTRAWSEDEWNAAVDGLRSRGLVEAGDDLTLTDEGRRHRQWVEDRTDANSVVAYEPLGEDGCERLRSIARPFSKAIVESGALG